MRRRKRKTKQVPSVDDLLVRALQKMIRRPPKNVGDVAGIIAGLFFDNMLQGMQQQLPPQSQQPMKQVRVRAYRVPQSSGIEAHYIPPRKNNER